MALRVRKSTLQAKLEVTEGVDPGSWATGDVLSLTAIAEAMNPDTIQLNEFGGSLDTGETILGAFKPVLTARGAFRGSGSPAVPIPPFSALMQAAGFIETLHTATIPSAAAQICTGGAANNITFDPTTGTGTQWPATTAAGVSGATSLLGEVIELAGNPATPTWATITDYSVTGAIATVTIDRNATDCGAIGAVFTSATTIRRQIGTKWQLGSPSPHPSVTARQFRDGKMNLFVGCRPNLRLTATTGSFLEFEFAIGGQFSSQTDLAVPVAPTFQSPPVGVNGFCTFTGGSLVAVQFAVKQFTLDLGNQGQYPDDVNQLSGVQPYLIGSRKVKCQVDPLTVLVGTQDRMTVIRNQTKGDFVIGWGPKTNYGAFVGNKVSIFVDTAKFLDDTMTEDNVVLRDTLPFEPTSFDNGVILYHW
jgi:hypothetical protein